MWMAAIIIFVGGGFGAVAREFFMLALKGDTGAFPIDIFAANIVASFVLGLIFGLHESKQASNQALLLISTGFCGGMSTFSSFIYGVYSVGVAPGDLGISIFYVVASLLVGYGAAWLGLAASSRIRTA